MTLDLQNDALAALKHLKLLGAPKEGDSTLQSLQVCLESHLCLQQLQLPLLCLDGGSKLRNLCLRTSCTQP